MNRLKKHDTLILTLVTLGAAALFVFLYWRSLIPIEAAEPQTSNPLEDWDISQSDMNSRAFEENKGIYELNTDIYDVYISIFPSKNEDGKIIDFSSFDLHEAFNHDYNPTLNCNVQILPEGKKPDPLVDLDHKNASIRVRGNAVRGRPFKSYKVILEEEAGEFFGQKNLNINKHMPDVTKIAAKLQTDLLTDIPDIASYRTYFMRLWIRDTSLPEDEQEFTYYGLYTEIEQPNKTYLELRGLSPNAALYKARNFSFRCEDALRDIEDPEYSEAEFEKILGIREAIDHKKLLEMLEAVNDTTRDFQEIFNTYFDEENYLTWLAFNHLVGNEDIINQNYILYSPENSVKWYFVPWDFDGAFYFEEYSRKDRRPISLQGSQMLNQSVLHRRYLRLPGSVEKIHGKMQELLDNYITRDRVSELVNAYKPVFEKTMTLYPDISLLYMEPNELFPYWDRLYDHILEKYEEYSVTMEYPAPMFVALPEKCPDGSVRLSWEPSFSYQGRTVTYNVYIYADYTMQDLVYSAQGIPSTEHFVEEGLDDGIYYLLVTATDSAGHEQLNLERLVIRQPGVSTNYVDGLLEFTLK